MAKEKFLANVQMAVGTLLPPVNAERPYTNRRDLENILRMSGDWVSKASVEGFDRGDFGDLNPETREALDRNVSAFLEVASKVRREQPATPDQIDAAITPFLDVASIARQTLLDEWLESARRLIDEAREWAEIEGWPTKSYRWTMTERFLGTYELDRLIFGVMGSQMALIPVGRYAMRSRGSFDLAVMPAYESVMIWRGPSGKWAIDPLPGEKRNRSWNSADFREVSEKLARMG